MIRRKTLGPEIAFERTGAQIYRDTRPLGARLIEASKGSASGAIIGALAVCVVAEPAAIDLLVPLSALYAVWVLTRPVVLPLRLPKGARRKDYNHPQPGNRRPRMAEGIIYVGNDYQTQQELWIGNEDGRQHVAVPGTTGAGKTEALLSLACNALPHASGFIFVNGKGDNSPNAKVKALARRRAREDDVLELNFLVASGGKQSNTFNPFASGNADVIRELLVSQIEAAPRAANSTGNEVFMTRAVALLGALAPALVWVRDNKNVPIDIEKIRFATELQSIALFALDKKFRRLHVDTGVVETMDVSDIPEAYLYPLRAYLGETGGFDPTLPYNKQKSDEPAKQHSFVTMHFSATFTQLAVSLGHIFKCEIGDIDMRDVVLNRRILLVNLPALENSGETTAALGRIVVAAQRNVMAQTLGADLEGDYAEIVGNNLSIAPTPYPIIFDEVRYYVVPGMDKMLAMGRALGFMFYLGFQEVAGLRAQIGDAMYSLLGNANFQILMRLQEGSETRRYVEQTAGDTNVVQSSTYRVNDMGNYREAQHAEIRRVSRVEWNDLRGLIEGEAIILFGNRRVYAKLFYADVDLDGPMRLNRPIMLKPPTDDSAREIAASIEDVRDAVEKGWAQPDGEANDNPALKFLIEAFTQKAHIADDIEDYVDAVIVAAGSIEVVADPAISQTKLEPGKIPPAPPGELDPMLYSAGDHVASLEGRDGSVTAPVTEIDKQRSLAQVEELAGASAPAARIAAKEALAAGDAVAISARAILPPLPAGELRAVIDDLISMLDSIYA